MYLYSTHLRFKLLLLVCIKIRLLILIRLHVARLQSSRYTFILAIAMGILVILSSSRIYIINVDIGEILAVYVSIAGIPLYLLFNYEFFGFALILVATQARIDLIEVLNNLQVAVLNAIVLLQLLRRLLLLHIVYILIGGCRDQLRMQTLMIVRCYRGGLCVSGADIFVLLAHGRD